MKINPGILTALALLALFMPAPAAPTNEAGQLTARLTAICRGPGTIRPDYNGKFLVVGRTYTIVAKPGAGHVFTNWTDGYESVVTNFPRLTFVMKTNSVFIANFLKRDGRPNRLDGVSTANLPLTVLAAVRAAPPALRGAVLADWLATVATIRPGAMPSVISTVVTAFPELLNIAVATAVTDCPGETYGIVYAAAQTPSVNITNLVMAACTASPTQCYQIAQAVLDVYPDAGNLVLQAMAASVPELAAVIGPAASGTTSLTKNQTLQILAGALTQINWPINPVPPHQPPYDYSTP
jgi:hypothetical protein